tara:strand:- start:811 stop:1572 length:762 start_codon:yes stop_codon:yes gene_type:complete
MKTIGVVHLKALPGSPSYENNLSEIYKSALEDSTALQNGGVDSIIIENFGDIPFTKNSISKLTLAHFTNIAKELSDSLNIDIGINVLRNDGESALSIADSINANFVRINILSGTMYTDQGIIEGKANKLIKLKNSLSNNIEIYADVFVKHAVPPIGYTIENQTEELLLRAGADKIIITGDGTGKEINFEQLEKLREIVPKGQLAIGSGVNESNIENYKNIADILIIGTGFKVDQNIAKPIDVKSVEKLIKMIK